MQVGRIRASSMAVACACVVLALAACEQKTQLVVPPPPKVTVSVPLAKPIQNAAEFTGQTYASQTVDLVARVTGFLEKISFADGSDVKKDQQLFLIEQAQYQAQVDLAQATIDQHQAQLRNAEDEYQRQLTLQRQDVSTAANLDKALANRDSEKAAVAEGEANLKIAQVNLSYTTVTAPFDGRIGRRLVDVGNLVGAGSPTTLATLSNIDTIYVYFTVNERDFLRFRAGMAERGITRDLLQTIKVYAGLETEEGAPHEGHLDFVDTGLDTTTGTIQVRAVFDNSKRTLVPGLFARLRIPYGEAKPALLVPDVALGFDQVGPYVMVVDDKGAVAQKRVALGATEGGLKVVTTGLDATDRVVIDGVQYATPGRTVTAVDGTIAAPTGQ